ncbi:MAG: ATP-binding protein [Eudoraea sp.]
MPKIEPILYFILLLILPLCLIGQKRDVEDTIVSALISKSSDENSLQINIYNQLENFSNNSDKRNFLKELSSYALRSENLNIIIFSFFLEGEHYYSENKIEEAIQKFKEVWLRSKEEDNNDGLLLGSIGLQSMYAHIGNKDSVEFYSEYSKKSFTKSTNPFALGFYQRRLGTLEIKKGNYTDAITYLLAVIEKPALQNSCLKSLALTNIGWIYEQLNYSEKAKIYYLKAKKVSARIDNQSYLNFNNLKLAHIELFKNNNPKLALESYQNLEKVYAGTNKYQEGIIYGTMGFAYLKTGDDDKSLEYLIKSRDFFERSKDSSFLCLPYSYLSHFYANMGQFENSIRNAEKALLIIDKRKLFDERKLIPLDALAFSYKALNNNEKAFAFLNELNITKTKLDNKKNNVAFLEGQYELLESHEKLKIAELNNQLLRKDKIIYISIVSILLITLLYTYHLFRNRKKLNSQLKTLNILKSNFFANISHEFRTPLTLISSPIQEALEEPELPQEKRNHFEMASRNTKRLLSLLDQLLDLSKIDSGALQLQLEKGFPTQMLAAWSDSFSYLAKQKKIEFEILASDKAKKGWFDRDALEKIMVNLLGNAIKYTPENGKIEVNISMPKEHINFYVRNTGKGMTKQQMKSIFDRFYQSDRFSDGVGIGLSLVKELTELHKGTITVSQEADQWTTFSVNLSVKKSKFKNAKFIEASENRIVHPLPKQELDEVYHPQETKDNGLPILLIVEDNPDVQILLFDTFKNSFKILIATNGKEGIEKAVKHIPDIILSDVMMPVQDGIVLTKTLKNDERTSHIPVVLLTARAGDENKFVGLEVGADDYITKPFNQKILKRKVENLIALRKKLQLRYSQEVILKPKDIAISSIDELFLEKVQRVLDEKLSESTFTVADFSQGVHMSRMQLHRKLKALTGLSSTEFLRSQRLKLATQILKQSSINISEVGYRVGFNDHAYFTKCFKKAYNCTPSEFVKRKK